MLSAFQNSLASAFRKALRILGMANDSPKEPPFETPNPCGTDIERYIVNLKNGYNDSGSARMNECTVAELYHCKEETQIGHKYVAAQVTAPFGTFYLSFERFRSQSDKEEFTTFTERELEAAAQTEGRPPARRRILQTGSDSVRASSDASARSLQGSSDSLTKTGKAEDWVSMSTSPTKRHTKAHVSRNINLPCPIQLYQVAVLAATVHQYALKYQVDDTNCYFYAEAITKVLQQCHGAQITKIPETLETGKVPMVRGTPLSNICSNLPNKTQISEIINDYESALERFERLARAKEMELATANAHADHESTRADHETARAEQEAKRARELEVKNAHLLQTIAAMKAEKHSAASQI